MSDEKLLPCPFCGASADPPELFGESKTAMFIDCSRCGASIYHGTADREANRKAVIAAWNRRTQSEGAVRTEGVDEVLNAVKLRLREHWLTGIHCDHERKTDRASCSCSIWRGEEKPSIDAAVQDWIEHAMPRFPNERAATGTISCAVEMAMLSDEALRRAMLSFHDGDMDWDTADEHRMRRAILAAASLPQPTAGSTGEDEGLRKRIVELEALVYVPGAWRCPKCRFTLFQRTLHAKDLNVSGRDEAGEKCPNCETPLWRVTERQERIEAIESNNRLGLENAALRDSAASTPAQSGVVDRYELADAFAQAFKSAHTSWDGNRPGKRICPDDAMAESLGRIAASMAISRLRSTPSIPAPVAESELREALWRARGTPEPLHDDSLLPVSSGVVEAIDAAFDERIGQKPGEHTPSILVRSQRRELAEIAAKAILSHVPSQPAPVVALNGYVLLPEKLTAEIACALEMAAPPPATSQEAADQLVADYSTVWSHVIALGTPASPQPDRESEELINRLREYASDWCIRAGSKQVVDDAIEYLSRGRSSQQEGVNAKLLAAAKFARKQLNHEKTDCWATGPRTGNPINDLIACPGCAAIAKLDQTITSSTRPQPQEGE